MNFTDMHIHLQDYKANCATDIIAAARAVGVSRLVCAATSEDDWPAVSALARQYPQTVIPAFGLHPWYAGNAAAGWIERLRDCLSAWPQALIGECGLDGLKENREKQTEVFAAQVALAEEMHRPLIIHAVRAVPLLAGFWPHLPERFMIHSFNGRPEHLLPILKYGGYVSFSASVLKNRDAADIVRLVPENRILLETDGPYQSPRKTEEQTPLFLPELLRNMAFWRQTEPARLAAAIECNAERFIYGK